MMMSARISSASARARSRRSAAVPKDSKASRLKR
jgi:hypothetical protein